MPPNQHFDLNTQSGFQQAFMTWSEAVRNFMYYKSGDLDVAEDITQEAFLRLWQQRAKVDPEKIKAFLFTVANNLYLDKVRHEKVKRNYQANYVQPGAAEDPQFSLESKEFGERLEKAINDLTEAQREVFLMNRVESLTYKEIAERLEISVKAVEKRMNKALKALAKLIKK